MSWESEANKKWDRQPFYVKASYVIVCIGLGLLLIPLVILMVLRAKITGNYD